MNESTPSELSALPSVNDLADHDLLASWRDELTRPVVIDAVRVVLDEVRGQLLGGQGSGPVTAEALARRVDERLMAASISPLEPVINATGILVHTGLGRAPVAGAAAEAMEDAARHYVPVEVDVETGKRGRRIDHVRSLLCSLTGAESATVVNNNAAAVHLVFAALAHGREVIVSRGELVEIGGSFRLPELMEASGARLREVGTTNRTRLRDYVRAINEDTAMILKVHPSNFRIEGFTAEASESELASLAAESNIPFVHDVGSGLLRPTSLHPMHDEPDASSAIAAGADLVMFSGDKILGGPQAGIIVGTSVLVDELDHHPLMRALRMDKVLLAGLRETLRLHQQESLAVREIPLWKMFSADRDELESRAREIVSWLRQKRVDADIDIVVAPGFAGGGAMPTRGFASLAIRVQPIGGTVADVQSTLRTAAGRRVFARAADGALWFDLRTVFPQQDKMLSAALAAALGSKAE